MIRTLFFSVLVWLVGTAVISVVLAPGVVTAAFLYAAIQALPLTAGLLSLFFQ